MSDRTSTSIEAAASIIGGVVALVPAVAGLLRPGTVAGAAAGDPLARRVLDLLPEQSLSELEAEILREETRR